MDKIIDFIRGIYHRGDTSYSDNYGRDVVEQWVKQAIGNHAKPLCLDVGCGDAQDLAIVKCVNNNSLLYGLDVVETNFDEYAKAGIIGTRGNLESERLSFSNETFDLVIANQVFEHLKNWVFALSEIARVLKPGGCLIIGVPNLASFHNRILLLFGRQPSCINTAGMHIRGFTYPGLSSILEYKQVFQVIDCQGRVFYPFPGRIGSMLSRIWPKSSASLFLLCVRHGNPDDYNNIEAMQKKNELSLS